MKRTAFALAAAVIAAGAAYSVLQRRAPAPEDSAPAPAAVPAPIHAPPPEVSPRTEFQRRVDAAQESLPTSEKIAALPEAEVHNTPQALIDASIQIGQIAEAIEKNPALGAEGMEFYAKCAKRPELAISVRAHCLHNLRSLGKKRNEAVDESGIADGVLKLEGPNLN